MRKVTDRLLERLHLVRWSDYKAIRDVAKNDSKLCADLVGECNSQGRIIDELSDENAKLKTENDKLNSQLTKMADDYTKLEEKLERVNEKRASLREYLGNIQDLTMAAFGEDDWPKYPDEKR